MQYFIAGYWFLFIFTSMTSKKMSYQIKIILACVISYMLVSLLSTINILLIHSIYLEEPLVISGISIILSTIGAIFISRLYVSKLFHNYMINKFHKSPNDDIWRDVFDFNKGTNLKVYLKGEPFYLIGHYKCHEEKENDSWLALSAFSKNDRETNLNYKNEPDYGSRDDIFITVRFSDIEHIEIF